MAPRIQVFNHIACRALQSASLHPIQSSVDPQLLVDCSSSDVAARAAKIQAGAILLRILPNTTNCAVSCDYNYERSERCDDRFLE